jgi:hypothetical protein
MHRDVKRITDENAGGGLPFRHGESRLRRGVVCRSGDKSTVLFELLEQLNFTWQLFRLNEVGSQEYGNDTHQYQIWLDN